MQHLAEADANRTVPESICKWDALRALATARRVYGLSDRDLNVLQALLSFHPGTQLEPEGNLVVHPSNRSICARLNGMANSTMRRHLARLVGAGILIRRDSPNGKRYARRQGAEKIAFGFDLSPLLRRSAEFQASAAEAEAAEAEIRQRRETVSLMRRDLAALTVFGRETHPDLGLWDRLADLATLTAQAQRRKLDRDALEAMERELQAALREAEDILLRQDGLTSRTDTTESSTSDVRNEQHIQSSEKDYFERERGQVTEPTPTDTPATDPDAPDMAMKDRTCPNIPLRLVLQVCGEIQTYLAEPVRQWRDLVRAAQLVSPMMGISRSAWDGAMRVMGPEGAAVTVAAMLERISEIRSPGGYLRCLTSKAAEGRFSCGPMVAALHPRTGRA